jgi:DNA topoisomerase II
MATTIETRYRKHNLRDHIYDVPDTYIGSVESTSIETWLFGAADQCMRKRQATCVPGLYKIFDEILVNAIDQVARLRADAARGVENVRSVKSIKVSIDRATGYIEVFNGDGIDVVEHPEHRVYVPEMIFGHLLTSTNYNKNEDRLTGGKNGYGAKLTNIFSAEFTIETLDHRRSLQYAQTFRENMTVIGKPTIRKAARALFTRIRFLPDYRRFQLEGLTDDTADMLCKRVYDACACTERDVSVLLNGAKLSFKDFERYADLFFGPRAARPRAFERVNDRWSVAVACNHGGAFEQVSFVNGISTLRGGRHVDSVVNQIAKALAEAVAAKKKKAVKPQHLKDNMIVFVKAAITNPSFDSQTKETLTTQASAFGLKCELSAKFLAKAYSATGIVEKATQLSDFHDQKKLSKTDGKKRGRISVPKLDDATHAGTKDSASCTLILTEGDSARTMAIAGLSVVGREKYGVFPLRGKILNVKDAPVKKILKNHKIASLKKIIGLEQGREYSDTQPLRYGRVMVMTDQDVDGSHIKGLLFNVFQSLWPSLYRMPGFVTSMLTPIVKATHKQSGTVTEFYNLSDYDAWQGAIDGTGAGFRVKYYKGLGTSTESEAKQYFRDLRVVTYEYSGKPSDEGMDLARSARTIARAGS